MCHVFSQTFRQREFPVRNAIYHLYPFYTSRIHAHKWLHSRGLGSISETVSFAIIDHLYLQALRQNNVWSLKDSILRTGWISPLPISASSGSGFYARKLDLHVDFDIIKGWLKLCTTHHLAYRPAAYSDRYMLPTKLIECEARSIVTGAHGQPYVALSYVWGRTSDAESDHGTNLTSLLPNTIEDAITATQKLGFRYIWIDRYCINQSDKEEKTAQIQQMDLIYGSASCTIVAASSGDPSTGLPGVSSVPRESRSYTTAWA
jgi:hypothetical protein